MNVSPSLDRPLHVVPPAARTSLAYLTYPRQVARLVISFFPNKRYPLEPRRRRSRIATGFPRTARAKVPKNHVPPQRADGQTPGQIPSYRCWCRQGPVHGTYGRGAFLRTCMAREPEPVRFGPVNSFCRGLVLSLLPAHA